MPQLPRTGFIGVGDMGGPMAMNMIKAGYPTTLWARRAASLEQYAGLDFQVADSLVELGRACDFVGLCVFDDDDVRQVMLGEQGILSGMAPGGIVAVHATISGDTAREVEAAAAAKGISILDAPVSGSRHRSEAGTLAIMVGGEEETFARARPILASYARVIELLGPVGSGQRMKLLTNMLGFCNLRMAYLAVETGVAMGMDRDAVGGMLRATAGQSFNLEVLLDRLYPQPDYARHAKSMTVKDTKLFSELIDQLGIESSRLDQIAREAIDVVDTLGRR